MTIIAKHNHRRCIMIDCLSCVAGAYAVGFAFMLVLHFGFVIVPVNDLPGYTFDYKGFTYQIIARGAERKYIIDMRGKNGKE